MLSTIYASLKQTFEGNEMKRDIVENVVACFTDQESKVKHPNKQIC